MTTKEKIRGILEQWHLPILEDAEKVIMTRFQINYIQIKFMGDDDSRALTTNLDNLEVITTLQDDILQEV